MGEALCLSCRLHQTGFGAFDAVAMEGAYDSVDDSEMEVVESFNDLLGRPAKYMSGEGGVVLMYQPHCGLSYPPVPEEYGSTGFMV